MISLEVEGLSMSHEFVVVQNLICDILLGYEFLYRYNVKIDFKNRTASFMDGLVVAKLTTSQEELRREVRIINFVNLKPHSEAIVPVCLQRRSDLQGRSCWSHYIVI